MICTVVNHQHTNDAIVDDVESGTYWLWVHGNIFWAKNRSLWNTIFH